MLFALYCNLLVFSLAIESRNPTECVRYLDWQNKIIIYESFLTPFESSNIFDAAGAQTYKPNRYN